YTSLAYFVVMIRMPFWSAYLEVLNQSPFVREYILRNDLKRMHSSRRVGGALPGMQETAELNRLTNSGLDAWRRNRFEEARDEYLQAIALADAAANAATQPGFRANLSTCLNNLAWLLATCPDKNLRDARGAVKYGRRAVEVAPQSGDWWNTLGVAYYRTGQW